MRNMALSYYIVCYSGDRNQMCLGIKCMNIKVTYEILKLMARNKLFIVRIIVAMYNTSE